MLKHLIDHQGLGKNKGDTVVFGGFSAGGIGSMVHLDAVAELLEPMGLKVLGLHDSPLHLDLEPVYPDRITPLNVSDHLLWKNFEVKGQDIIPKDCTDAQPEGKEFRCIFGQYRLHYMKTPFLIFADQFDAFQIPVDDGGKKANDPSLTEGEKVFANNFGAFTKEYLKALRFPNKPFPGGVFSPACNTHAISYSDKFFTMKTIGNKQHGPVSQKDVLTMALHKFESGE